ncbi:MAG: ATP-binding cassette domain-containing protein [Alphaproteobacteria bacterium]|nr:ATP-binding cassette domain-containing protein [Alphaproteobacteria bacterium]
MVIVMALLDAVGVASIMPFIAVLTDPTIVEKNSILNWAYQSFNFTNKNDFLIFLGTCVFLMLVFSLTFKALTLYVQFRYVLMREYSVGKRLLLGYLHQPYEWFLMRNTSELSKNILSEVANVINYGLLAIVVSISQVIVVITLISLLVLVNSKLAISAGVVLGLAYVIIYLSSVRFFGKIGAERTAANSARFNVVGDVFGAVKEVKLASLEDIYARRFEKPAFRFSLSQVYSNTMAQLPRYSLEAISFGGMMLVLLYLMSQTDQLAEVLPVVALYAFAGYRLMPALQQIYGSLANLKYIGPALNVVYADYCELKIDDAPKPDCAPILVNEAIELKNVSYKYRSDAALVLDNLSLKISAGTKVGLVGSTGSGKTTIVDLILGLLEPLDGNIFLDDIPLTTENKIGWQKTLGYVPQNIYLSDASIKENIAFGIELDEIDMDAVERASKIANLDEFVTQELPEKYDTMVGERGVRLSGGQLQRIGIARALYHDPQVLILDEATSALDGLTEAVVMEAVNNLSDNMTIIMIAHRINTVMACDEIYLLQNGSIVSKGTFDELLASSKKFKSFSKA